MTIENIKAMTDKQLINTLSVPMIDDLTFTLIQNELYERGYKYCNGWIKEEA